MRRLNVWRGQHCQHRCSRIFTVKQCNFIQYRSIGFCTYQKCSKIIWLLLWNKGNLLLLSYCLHEIYPPRGDFGNENLSLLLSSQPHKEQLAASKLSKVKDLTLLSKIIFYCKEVKMKSKVNSKLCIYVELRFWQHRWIRHKKVYSVYSFLFTDLPNRLPSESYS
jgi:hypothetical protein